MDRSELGKQSPREFFEEWERLRGVAASELADIKHGSFVRSFLEAYCSADWENAVLLTPVLQRLEKKYQLVDRFVKVHKHQDVDQSPGK